MLDPQLVAFIKKQEGFTPVAKWDEKQWTVGYGTRAQHPHEAITQYEAEHRLDAELTKAVETVERFCPSAPQGVKDALASLTFNSGTEWERDNLGTFVKAGDWANAKAHFLMYNKAGGKTLADLVERRKEEAAWFPEAAPAPEPVAQIVWPTPTPVAEEAPPVAPEAPHEGLLEKLSHLL